MDLSESLPDLDAERVNEMARMFWYSAILRAGIKLDVFSLLEDSKRTSTEVARSIEASPRYVQAFLDSCVSLELLEKRGDTYSNSNLASKFLAKGKKEYVGDHALHHTNTWAAWGQLDEIVKEGKTLLPFETGYVDAATYWNDYMIGQHNRAASGQAYYLVENVDLRSRRKLLDLGGGAGSYSIALCDANPELKAVILDQKEPLSIAKTLVDENNLQARITLQEGDFLETELGTGYDVALISGVVLIQSEEKSRRLVRRALDALVPGGMVIIQDYMRVDHSPERSKLDTLEDMYVLVSFDPGAGNREGAEVSSWLEDVGYQNIEMIALPTQLALITAEKPRTR